MSLRSVFFKIDRIYSFDIHASIFAFSKFLFSIKQAALLVASKFFRPAAALKPEH